MSTDPDYHRTFMRLEMIRAWGGYCWVNAAGLPYRRAKQNQNEGFKAFQAVGADLNDIYIHPRDDQNFWHYATAWEKTFSTLCGSSSSREAVPVVDEHLTVVGHCGLFFGSRIFIRKGAEPMGVGANGITREFKPGEAIFVRAWRPSPSYVSLPSREFEVYVTPDGAVRRIEGGAVLEGAEPSISPLDFMSFGRLGQMVGRVVFPSVRGCSLKSIEFKGRPRLQAEGPAEPLAQQAAREAARAAATSGAASTQSPAVQRVLATICNMQKKKVVRSVEMLERPTVFRHTITSDNPAATFVQIQRKGHLSFSTGGNAHYGDGVYAWPANAKGIGQRYIDIEVGAGNAAELLKFPNGSSWYRIVSPSGDTVTVRIVRHNFTPEELAFARKLVGD